MGGASDKLDGVDGVTLRDDNGIPTAVLSSAWRGEMLQYILDSGATGIELNHARGWSDDNVEFLYQLPGLVSCAVIDWKIDDVSPVNALRNLERLKIFTYCKTQIEFQHFEKLKSCAIEWRAGAASLFSCSTLVSLFINRYRAHSAHLIGQLQSLNSLSILNSPLSSIAGLGQLSLLKELQLANLSKLQSLTGLSGLSNLQELSVNGCRKLRALEATCLPMNLRMLALDDCGTLESLEPLRALSQLKELRFTGDTNILDGKMEPLLELPNLRVVRFRNRKHYSATCEQVSNRLGVLAPD